MPPPTATATRPEPVLVAISRRPPAEEARTLPIPLDVDAIADDAFIVIGDIDKESEAAMCNCSASDDNPY
ncbi:hypothetical protein ACIRLA_35945 [Streptomyces sp. NPDC102364]|uniref:hypothetical protein n=1 Tax=Streptomyces sp. NPDC102364 TaxID=3366161 RepID=UPI00382D97DA